MIDLHSHILPGIDDGAKTLDDSLEMARIAANNGTTVMVATPHVIEGQWMPEWSEITALCNDLNRALKQEKLELNIIPGAEVALNMDILDVIKGPGPYCINNGRYMLVELPATHIPQFTDDFFFTLQARGITPIVAHPERYPELAKDPEKVIDWVNRGILLQVNGPSLIGKMGEKAMKLAELLFNNNLVHCIGSDAHSPRTRTPRLAESMEKLMVLAGNEEKLKIIQENSLKIINNEEIEVPIVHSLITDKKTGLLNRILGMIS